MRKMCFILLVILSVMSVSACGEKTPSGQIQSLDLSAFLETAELPENLSISFDPSEVRAVSSARIYKANLLTFDPDAAAKEMLRMDVVDTQPTALGISFQTGDKFAAEYLTVFDGGKQFGVDSGVNGGLSYSMYINGPDHKSLVIANEAGPPSLNEQLSKSKWRNDYKSYADLSFMPYADALAAVEEKLAAVGFPQIGMAEAYSMDVETMREHYALYLEENRNVEDRVEDLSWSQDDEGYLFHFRQLIDDIPVINVSWQWGKGSDNGPASNFMDPTTITVIFTRDGITQLYASNLYDLAAAESGEEQPLIGAAQALHVLLVEYGELLLEKGTRVVSAELCYVSIPAGGASELIPAWVFATAKPGLFRDPVSGAEFSYDNYSQYVVNAITGEKMSGIR